MEAQKQHQPYNQHKIATPLQQQGYPQTNATSTQRSDVNLATLAHQPSPLQTLGSHPLLHEHPQNVQHPPGPLTLSAAIERRDRPNQQPSIPSHRVKTILVAFFRDIWTDNLPGRPICSRSHPGRRQALPPPLGRRRLRPSGPAAVLSRVLQGGPRHEGGGNDGAPDAHGHHAAELGDIDPDRAFWDLGHLWKPARRTLMPGAYAQRGVPGAKYGRWEGGGQQVGTDCGKIRVFAVG
ncbi:unnamed protein product [Ostreobium quekettii]|uniref:Uncharacterized protein n=1 Tax=Ostreobium quekettii TaxID=121088 RepID=A0A8S1IP13_9CHLO|nr:unnamed protein product [Ostreobium quekettii]